MNQDDDESAAVWPPEADDYYGRLITLARDLANYAGARLDDGGRELVDFTVGRPSDGLAALIQAAPPSCVRRGARRRIRMRN